MPICFLTHLKSAKNLALTSWLPPRFLSLKLGKLLADLPIPRIAKVMPVFHLNILQDLSSPAFFTDSDLVLLSSSVALSVVRGEGGVVERDRFCSCNYSCKALKGESP